MPHVAVNAGGGGLGDDGTPYSELYGEPLSKRGAFLRLKNMKW